MVHVLGNIEAMPRFILLPPYNCKKKKKKCVIATFLLRVEKGYKSLE